MRSGRAQVQSCYRECRRWINAIKKLWNAFITTTHACLKKRQQRLDWLSLTDINSAGVFFPNDVRCVYINLMRQKTKGLMREHHDGGRKDLVGNSYSVWFRRDST